MISGGELKWAFGGKGLEMFVASVVFFCGYSFVKEFSEFCGLQRALDGISWLIIVLRAFVINLISIAVQIIARSLSIMSILTDVSKLSI